MVIRMAREADFRLITSDRNSHEPICGRLNSVSDSI